MGYYRASFGSGGYSQQDIDSYCIVAGNERFLPETYLFSNNQEFNSPINIGDNVFIAAGLVFRCNNYNSPITIGANIWNCQWMFANCYNFNQPVTFTSKCSYFYSAFDNCRAFNQPVILGGDSATNINLCKTFMNCYNFNQPITIPENTIDMNRAFYNCENFQQSITIPSKVTNCYEMLYYSENYCGDIYIKGNQSRNLNVSGMCGFMHNNQRKNIHFNNVFNGLFNNTTSKSIRGGSIVWTDMPDGNGFYNANYNIWCYNNYEG